MGLPPHGFHGKNNVEILTQEENTNQVPIISTTP